MPEIIRSTFPERPGLSLVVWPLADGLFAIEAQVDGIPTGRVFAKDRWKALQYYGAIAKLIAGGKPLEDLPLGLGSMKTESLPEVVDMAALGASVGSTEYFGALPYAADNDPDGGHW